MGRIYLPLMAVLIGVSGLFSAAAGNFGGMLCLVGWYLSEWRRLRLEDALESIRQDLMVANKEITRD